MVLLSELSSCGIVTGNLVIHLGVLASWFALIINVIFIIMILQNVCTLVKDNDLAFPHESCSLLFNEGILLISILIYIPQELYVAWLTLR